MLRFQNDYSEGAHPNVLRALCDTNLCVTAGYGLDDDCRRAADAIRARFACPDADVHFLVGGTQTNQLAAAAFLRPWEAMVAADTGHINVHETGAIEATGHKVIAMPGTDGKLTPAAIAGTILTLAGLLISEERLRLPGIRTWRSLLKKQTTRPE